MTIAGKGVASEGIYIKLCIFSLFSGAFVQIAGVPSFHISMLLLYTVFSVS